MAVGGGKTRMRRVALSEVKDDLSKYLRLETDPRFLDRIAGLVEAAGVEPASGGVTGEATPCSASSWFSPRRLKKRQNSGGATPNCPSGDPDRLHPHLASAYGTRRVRFPDTVTAR